MRSENKTTIDFETDIYSVQAVKYAIYDLDLMTEVTRDPNERTIRVRVLSQDEKPSNIKDILKQKVFDHQIRIDVEKEFGPIRKLILAQAFFPCENLDEILDEINP